MDRAVLERYEKILEIMENERENQPMASQRTRMVILGFRMQLRNMSMVCRKMPFIGDT